MNGSEFRQMRESIGLSQSALADEWGMGRQGCGSVGKWERGVVPVNPIAAYCIDLMHENKDLREAIEVMKVAIGHLAHNPSAKGTASGRRALEILGKEE